MASQAKNDCLSNPNFAVICSFLDRYGESLSLPEIGYSDLQEWIEDTKSVSPVLIDLHVRLLRRIHKKLSNVTADRWERGIVKFCHKYSNVDAWEMERFGYKLAKTSTKLTLLKNLLENQFDFNSKFKDKINEIPIDEMRFQPIGRDKTGMAYWYFLDKEINLRVYREHQDDVDSESWELVCRSRDDLAKLINGLENGTDTKLDRQESSDQSEPVSDNNEDSRDSFKQKTPLGPSPLTIKQEPSEDSNSGGDLKPSALQKFNKCDNQSPSKLLKDKFVKEKGVEIQKIMCKMKQEGLVDSESDEDKKTEEKMDEVDGIVNEEGAVKNVKEEMQDSTVVKPESVKKENVAEEETADNENERKIEDEIKLETKTIVEEKVETKTIVTEEVQMKTVEEEKVENNAKVLDRDQGSENSKREVDDVHVLSKQLPCKNDDSVEESVNKEECAETKTSVDRNMEDTASDEKSLEDKTNDHVDDCPLDTDQETKDTEVNEQNEIKSDRDESEIRVPSSEKQLPEEKGCVEQFDQKVADTETKNEQNSEDQVLNSMQVENNELDERTKETPVIKNTEGKVDNEDSNKDMLESVISLTEKEEAKEKDEKDSKEGPEKQPDEIVETKINSPEPKDIVVTENQSACSPNKPTLDAEGTSHTKHDQCKDDDITHSETKTEKEIETKECDSNEVKGDKVANDNNEKSIEKDSVCDDYKSTIEESKVYKTENGDSSEKTDKDMKSDNQEIVENDKKTADDSKVDIPDTGNVQKEISELKESLETDLNVKTDNKQKPDIVEKSSEVITEKEESQTKNVDEKSVVTKSDTTEALKKARKRKQNEIATTPDSSTEDEKHIELPTKRNIKTVVRKSPNKFENESAVYKCIEDNEGDKVVLENSDVIEEHKDKSDISNNAKEKSSINESEETEDKKDDSEKNEKANSIQHNEDISEVWDKSVKECNKEDTVDEVKPEDINKKDEEINDNIENEAPVKVRGLVQTRKKSKAQKRQAVDSDEMEPAEPASKRSKMRGRVSSRGRGKQRGANYDSSSTSEDDLPLSQVAGRGRGGISRGRSKAVGKSNQAPKVSPKKCKAPIVSKKSTKPVDDIPAELSEDESGRRRSARVRSMRARKKSPSPDYVPSGLDDTDEEFHYDDDDDEFTVKSNKKKKKEPKEVVEEAPKGRNALRHEEKAKKKEVEEEEAACVKCLRSHQPEWILLCDKCDAGYHTACLRPPLMIIPDGDWFCPPCEHVMLKVVLEENLKSLDQAILKNDRLVRRKERLAFVSISLDNVLKEPEPQPKQEVQRKKKPNYRESDAESETGSGSSSGSSDSTSESESSSDGEGTRHSSKSSKQKFVQRACRAKKSVSYRFEEYDELIMDAIEEDLSIPKEPKPRKTKPPGISRGKDMSNILGASDEETESKPVRKRKPRLTELDEDVDDDDTDDYQLSDASNASDATKSSEPHESEDVSEDSIETSCRKTTRGQRKSRRKGGWNNRFKDFIVDSDFESDDDKRRSNRGRKQRKKVNYREINSDETEVEEEEDSFHSSELSDSDFEHKRRKREQKSKTVESEERPRSGKRQRIRRVSSSSESSEGESDESTSKKNKGKKPPQKSARYESEDSEDSDNVTMSRKTKTKKFQELPDDSESDADTEETIESDASEEVNVKKPKDALKKKVIESETEDEEEVVNKKNESQETNSSCGDESGWEEIGIGSGEEVNLPTAVKKAGKKAEDTTHTKKVSDVEDSDIQNKKEEVVNNNIDVSAEKTITEQADNSMNVTNEEQEKIESEQTVEEGMLSATEVTPPKKKRGRNPKGTQGHVDGPEASPKKRGRKPKAKAEVTETVSEETPVKKKRGRKSKLITETIPEGDVEKPVQEGRPETDVNIGSTIEMVAKMPEGKKEAPEITEGLVSPDESSIDKNECSPNLEKAKDDSPLSVRNKQNAPVGIVKPEVRQGVIVENKQVIEGRVSENRSSDSTVNPLQGMRDLAMGSQPLHGGHESSFTPYSQANYAGPNMQGYMHHQGFHNYHPQPPPYGPHGPSGPSPYPGHQSMPSEGPHPRHQPPTSQFHQNQSSMSPNSFQQNSSYMSHMQQSPPGYFPGNYRPQMGGRPEGFGPQNPQGTQSPNFQGQFPPNYPHQGPYQGPPRHGFPEHHGQYPMGPQGSVPSQQGQGAYHPGMPFSMQGPPRQGFWPQGGPQGPSPGPQPFRPQSRPSPSHPQGVSPTAREGVSEAPNRGFMMDNILKPAPEGGSNDVEDSAEVSDIDRYTSFLCKSE